MPATGCSRHALGRTSGKRLAERRSGTIRDPSAERPPSFVSRSRHRSAFDIAFWRILADHVRPERHLRSARAQPLATSGSAATSTTALFAPRDSERCSQHGPRYVGHELAVPEVGDFYALPQEGEGRALVRTPDGRAS